MLYVVCLFCETPRLCHPPSAHKGGSECYLYWLVTCNSNQASCFIYPLLSCNDILAGNGSLPISSLMSVSTLTPSSTIQLPGNIRIPQLGFGVYLSPTEITGTSVTHALHAGYRHIDTAQIYRNEKQVGEAVRSFLLEQKGRVRRQDIWVTSKLRDEKGRLPKKLDNVPRVLRESIETICGNSPEMEGYVDLFLIHSPYAGADGRRLQWQGLEDLKREGKTRAIGVSN